MLPLRAEVMNKTGVLLVVVAVLLFAAAYWATPKIIGMTGLFFIIGCCLQWRLRGGIASALWTTVAVGLSFAIHGENLALLGISVLVYFLLAFSLGIVLNYAYRQQAELEKSQMRYRALFEATGAATVVVEPDDTVSLVNRKTEELTGYSKEEIEGKMKWQDFVFEDELELMNSYRKLRLEKVDEAPQSYEFTYRDSEDNPKKALLIADIITETREVIASVVDITGRVRIEEKLKESEENLSIILQSIGDGVIVTDTGGYVTRMNLQAENLTGWKWLEAVGKPLSEVFNIINSRTGELELNPAQQVIETGKKVGLANDTVLISRNGSRYYISDSAAPVYSREGEITGVVMVFSDITEEYQAREALKESEEKFRTLAESSPLAIMIYQEDVWVYVNSAAEKITGHSKEELYGMYYWKIVHPDYRQTIWEKGQMRQAGDTEPFQYDFKIITKEGKEKWVSLTGALITFQGKPAGFISVMDINARKEAEEALRESEEKYREILATMEDGYYEANLKGIVTFCNESAARTLGYTVDGLIGKSFQQICKDPEEAFEKFNRVYQSGRSEHSLTMELVRSDGTTAIGEFSLTLVRNDEGRVTGFRGIGRDVTERKRYEEQLKYLSMHDQLTDLYNRAYFENELNRLSGGREYPVTIISVDLDGLKLVNDTLGHEKGDELLKACAMVLQDSLRRSDILARVGGDEFVAILPRTGREKGEEVVERIKSNVELYNRKNEHQVPLSISVGLSTAEKISKPLEEAFREADDLMYRDKLHKGTGAKSQIIRSLMLTLGERDYITEGHAQRLEELCLELGKRINLTQKQLSDLALLAQVHDLGKVGIPDRILFKKGPLNEEEWEIMRQHSEKGFRIALSSTDLSGIADLILKHHERWDGKGYPMGLAGKEIPVECRILAIVDAYDAMTNDRPYQRAQSREEAIKELKKEAGRQFDPDLVKEFILLLGEKGAGDGTFSKEEGEGE